MTDIENFGNDALSRIAAAQDLDTLEGLRVAFLGKQGSVSGLLKTLGGMSPEERQAVEKAGQYAYRDRKVKKRSFRALWIQRINAAVRAEGLTYSQFIHGAKLAGVTLDRKIMADLAMNEGGVFSAVIAQAKAALPAA